MVDVIREALEKSPKTALFTGLSGETVPAEHHEVYKSEPGLTAKMLRDLVKDLETDKRIGTCAICREPVWRSQYNGYLVYMDKHYHVDCLGRKLYRELT